jgi:hypothetical protein
MTPLAPTTTLLGSPTNQTPMPLTSMITKVDQMNRLTPPASAKVPTRISGTALP